MLSIQEQVEGGDKDGERLNRSSSAKLQGKEPRGRGFLSEYADVSKIPLESNAWAEAVYDRWADSTLMPKSPQGNAGDLDE